jgi:type IV pilus assembly protein PilE
MELRTSHARMRGVTLIELMMVITILAIIAAIAVPTYRKYLLRAQRTEAKVALLQLQTAEEKFYLQNNIYTDKVTVASTAATPGLGLPGTSETGKYDIAITTLATGGQSYTATASPRTGGGQTDDKDCANFSINERGVRTISGTKTPEFCWK